MRTTRRNCRTSSMTNWKSRTKKMKKKDQKRILTCRNWAETATALQTSPAATSLLTMDSVQTRIKGLTLSNRIKKRKAKTKIC